MQGRLKGSRNSQSGMVSIMVTMIMMLVISLIVLGFAQISRREQRQSLDRQLSTQAFLAAESGVNDARDTIRATLASGGDIQEKTECAPTPEYPITKANPIINAANQVSYPCLLVSTHLKDITVNPLTAGGNSVNVPVEPAIGTIGVLHVNWTAMSQLTNAQVATNCKNNPPGSGNFPTVTAGGWTCPYGVLRLDIIPTDTLDRTVMAAKQKTMFLYPTQGGASTTVDYATSDGATVKTDCKAAKGCTVDITNMVSSGSTKYAIRLNAIYADVAIDITADDTGGASLELKNAQVQVDATGKAQDVLRRVQVRLPLAATGNTPDYAVETGSSICKRYKITANSFVTPSDIKGQDQNNPMCKALTVSPPPPPPPACNAAHDILMALDTSSSMTVVWEGASRRDELRKVATDFVNKTNVGVFNQESIIGFSGIITQYVPLTGDRPTLLNAIASTPTITGTNYDPPVQKSYDILINGGRAGAQKTLVFISDGLDTAGNKAFVKKTTDDMKAAGVTIYTVGINPDNTQFVELQSMASPGKFFDAQSVAQLQAMFDQIAQDVNCT